MSSSVFSLQCTWISRRYQTYCELMLWEYWYWSFKLDALFWSTILVWLNWSYWFIFGLSWLIFRYIAGDTYTTVSSTTVKSWAGRLLSLICYSVSVYRVRNRRAFGYIRTSSILVWVWVGAMITWPIVRPPLRGFLLIGFRLNQHHTW